MIYNSTYTRGPLDTSAAPTAGGEFASFLLGVPAGQMGRTASYAERDYYFALYLQDDWKVTRKLSVNIGLRMEHESPLSERYNRAVTDFAFGQSNPIEAAARCSRTPGPAVVSTSDPGPRPIRLSRSPSWFASSEEAMSVVEDGSVYQVVEGCAGEAATTAWIAPAD